MPSQKEMMERFKRDFPEEYARQQKLAQEILKDIPNREMPRFFGMDFPKELDKKCTKEEFHKMITTINDSDVPIESVNFLDYPAGA